MTFTVAPDISNHNGVLTPTYPRDLVITKATQGTYFTDEHWATNSAVCAGLHSAGKLAGQVAYHVYTSESVTAQFAKFRLVVSGGTGVAPAHVVAGMTDLESWPGTPYALHGDHSSQVNDLNHMIADWLGSAHAAWLYANASDFDDLAPHRESDWPLILAAYTSDLRYRTVLGAAAIGQQYSDGETKWSVPTIDGQVLPRYTAGLGYVDHNVFPGFASGFALRDWIYPTQEDFIMQITTATQAQFNQLMHAWATSPQGQQDLHQGTFGDWNLMRDGHHRTAEQIVERIPGYQKFAAPAHRAEAPDAAEAPENIADRPVPGDHVPPDARTMHSGVVGDVEETS